MRNRARAATLTQPVQRAEITYRAHPCRQGGGIKVQHMLNMSTMKPTRQAWVLFSGEHSKNGMALNYCPVCGTDFMVLIFGKAGG